VTTVCEGLSEGSGKLFIFALFNLSFRKTKKFIKILYYFGLQTTNFAIYFPLIASHITKFYYFVV